ncbi:hypothetical protein CsSME_00002121 [Camellia sinensis var. sinensis]
MYCIQNLAKAFSSYEEEVLVKREELLQFGQGAIAGLKLNSDIASVNVHVPISIEVCSCVYQGGSSPICFDYTNVVLVIDFEVLDIHKILDGEKPKKPSTEETIVAPVEALKEAFEQVQLCSRLEELLLKKKLLNNGDSPEIHAKKVDKLKFLSESLANSASKAEKRISDHKSRIVVDYMCGNIDWLHRYIIQGLEWESTIDIWSMGSLWTIAVVILVNMHLAMDIKRWLLLTHSSVWGSIIITYACVVVLDSIPIFPNYGTIYHLAKSPAYWLSVLVIIVLALLPRFIWKVIH